MVVVRVFEVGIGDAVAMCSTNPATRLRMDHEIGTLREGTRADMILMDDQLRLMATIVNGNVVFRDEE